MGVNVILIAEKELTLVDTAFHGSSTRIVDFIHSLGRSVEEISLIIITHNHFDHVGGLDELRRIARLDFDILCFGHGRPFIKDGQKKVQKLLEKIKD